MSTVPTSSQPDVAASHREIEDQVQRLEEQFHGLQKQLWHAQRLASLGTMAAMVAHEYNNLMTPVVSFARYAIEQGDPELMRSAMEKILKQAVKANQLSDRVLNLAADQDKGPVTVPLRKLVDESVECLGRDLAKDNIGLTIEVDPAIQVRVNPGQIQQVFVNLFQNARQAMLGRRGRLAISAERIGPEMRVRVADTGSGIRSEDLPRVFEPFFTTKSRADRPDKRGIGLGLAICRDIVTSHGGSIDVQSQLGHGTTFTLTLPAAE
jgi:two-component system NtrC family sensor kinase